MIKHGDDLGMVYDVGFPILYTCCLDFFCHFHRDAPNFVWPSADSAAARTWSSFQMAFAGAGSPFKTWNRLKTWNRFNVVHRCSPQLDLFWLFWIKPMVFDLGKLLCFGTTNGFLTYFDIANFVDAPCAKT